MVSEASSGFLPRVSKASRILSLMFPGVGSDVIKSKMGMSRYWCLAAAAFVATIAQACALQIENPRHLWAVSSLAGRESALLCIARCVMDIDLHIWIIPVGYGITFGVFPALVRTNDFFP